VCDLGARLGLPTEHPSTGNIVVVESGNVTAGIVVDEVDQVLTVEAGQLVPVPVVGSDAMKSIVKIGDRLVVLLDSDAVFHGADLTGPVTAAAA
jgi:chemotaxis signal transduction protein